MNDILEILNDLITGKINDTHAAKKIYELKLPKKKTLSTINPLKFLITGIKVKMYFEAITMVLNLLLTLSITVFSIYITILLIKTFS